MLIKILEFRSTSTKTASQPTQKDHHLIIRGMQSLARAFEASDGTRSAEICSSPFSCSFRCWIVYQYAGVIVAKFWSKRFKQWRNAEGNWSRSRLAGEYTTPFRLAAGRADYASDRRAKLSTLTFTSGRSDQPDDERGWNIVGRPSGGKARTAPSGEEHHQRSHCIRILAVR